MNYSKIKAIVFDFWGVFATFNAPVNKAIGFTGHLHTFNQDYYDLIIQHDLGKLTEKEFLAAAAKIFKVELSDKHSYLFDPNDINHDLIKLVKQLKTKYKIGLMSNTSREYSEEFIFNPGFDKLFDYLILSYQVEFRKPDSRIYQHALEKVGLKPEEILFIDDHQKSLDPAVEIGMQTLFYEGKKTDEILKKLL